MCCYCWIDITAFDDAHEQAWNKLKQTGEKMYESVRIEMGTGINERFHAHLRFFCVKGDIMSIEHWKVLVRFAFLSFNNFPGWQKKVVDLFCASFTKD